MQWISVWVLCRRGQCAVAYIDRRCRMAQVAQPLLLKALKDERTNMPKMPSPLQNHLLAALPDEVKQRLFPHLEMVPLELGKVLYESGDTMRHVYFPTDSIVSLLYVMESGASAEISVVGNEGLIGIALFMGGGKHAKSRDSAECRVGVSAARPVA